MIDIHNKHEQQDYNKSIWFSHGIHTQKINVSGVVPESTVSNLYLRGTRSNHIDISYQAWYPIQPSVYNKRCTQANHGNILYQVLYRAYLTRHNHNE